MNAKWRILARRASAGAAMAFCKSNGRLMEFDSYTAAQEQCDAWMAQRVSAAVSWTPVFHDGDAWVACDNGAPL